MLSWGRRLQKKSSPRRNLQLITWVFGTPVYVHVPKEKRAKLEPFDKKGIFVGYGDCSKVYRVYIPGHRHIEVSRDVIFHVEALFRKTLELSSEDTIAAFEFLDLEIQREEEEFDDQIQMFMRTVG